MNLRTLSLFIAINFAGPAFAQPEIAPQPRPVLPSDIDPAIADWTPRPATGKAEPWEKATDKDWIDPRFREMNTGPALNCTMRYPLGASGLGDKKQEIVYKGTAVKLGDHGDAGIVFDRSTMSFNYCWSGGFLAHSDRRFGLLNTPTPKGDLLFARLPGPGWESPDGKWTANGPFTRPLDAKWSRYKGHYLHRDSVVFTYTVNGRLVLHQGRLVPDLPERKSRRFEHVVTVSPGKTPIVFGNAGTTGPSIDFEASESSLTSVANGPARMRSQEDPTPFTKGGPKRWGDPIVTKLVRGEENGPFAVDTLTIPYKNRFNALFFCTGLDFLKDGRIAVCTCHGDVWLVTIDENAGTCSWQRYATGLYHPLGLKVVDGKVVVLERGQLTRLHDLNSDGEADFYECVNNDWDTGTGEHSYDTCLETDPQGNYYFFKTGDSNLPTGGCLMRVSKDGNKAEVFATGFRHPIGMGMSPKGVLTGADQEGNWMPATRIDEYKHGGFYGDMRGHHRKEPPKTYDPPLCWLPREIDNSAGGQVWVPADSKWPLAGLPLHFSYGRCRPYVLLRQESRNGPTQGGVAALDVKFLSGVCRGRFATDGNLYVCGLNGWQTAAQADGCLQRVRYTGKPLDVPVKMEIEGNTVRLTFSGTLTAKSVVDATNYKAAWWNYRWSGEYGSKRWKVSNPNTEGQDEFGPKSAQLLPDGKTVQITFNQLQPVMQMQIGYNLTNTEGQAVIGSVFFTVHSIEE